MVANTQTTAYTRTLSDYALSIQPDQVPEDVRHETGRILLDCLGCAVAGLVTPAGKIAVDLAKGERGPLQSRVIGGGDASIMPAVFANAVLTNALDFDIYGPEGHVAPVAVPVALAVGDALDASGRELFSAIVAGMEIGGRVGGALRRAGMAGGAQLGFVRGHCHVAFAAAAAAGRLLQLTPGQMHHAFGIAGYGATVPTLRKFFASSDPPMTKYDHLGAMAQNGLQAALLARRGFTGDLEVLEGEDIGFWRFAGAQGCDWDHLVSRLGTEWTIREVSYKPFPVTLYTNPGIVLARRIMRTHGLQPEEIEHVEVRTLRAGEGGQPSREVRHALDAWLNNAYTMAAGVFDVRPLRTWQEEPTFKRRDLLAFMEKTHFTRTRDGEVTTKGNYWERWSPVRVTIEARGQTFDDGDDYLPRFPDEELTAKFHENVSGFIAPSEAEAIERHCWNLLDLPGTRQLTGLLPRG